MADSTSLFARPRADPRASRVPLRALGRAPAEAQQLRHSAAVAAAFGCVPRGQWALLEADMNALIDRSSCLVEPVLVGGVRLLFPVLVQAAPSPYPAQRPVAARENPHREAMWKVLCSRDARSESLSVVVVHLRPLQESPLLRALITTRWVSAAAHQVVISCDVGSLST